MNDGDIGGVIRALRKNLPAWGVPIVSHLAEERRDPFEILISTLLSLRTKDEVTAAATERLFRLADTPARMLGLSEAAIGKAIYPVGFYRNKARTIREICGELIGRFDSRVPDDIDTLLTLRGVGRKTEPRGLAWLRQAGNVRGHARAPDLQPPRIRLHEKPGRDGVRPEGEAAPALLGRLQHPDGDLRAAGLPARIPPLQPLSGLPPLRPEKRRPKPLTPARHSSAASAKKKPK